ncbi:MAG: cobalt-precorrin-5B (C(1))-methyltransferase CbiD [Thermodesulfobacteriota bacterium]
MGEPGKNRLRSGFTTGTAAAAAAKGAVSALVLRHPPERVNVALPAGGALAIPLHSCRTEGPATAVCTVVKDAGDDPDVTNGALIGARVVLEPERQDAPAVLIAGGPGVGRVTKPGLELPVGEPAINPVPRRMIAQNVREALDEAGAKALVRVEIFVPDGERLARKTLNHRLGIEGGLSILGTTGIVKPLSHEAYEETIRAAVSVARATGNRHLVFSTGRRSEKAAQRLFPGLREEAFIQMGDYFRAAMTSAAEKRTPRTTLTVFFGKALKMAAGIPQTHASRSDTPLDRLAGWVRDLGGHEELARTVLQANTARQAFFLLQQELPQAIAFVGRELVRQARALGGDQMLVDCVIFDFAGAPVFGPEERREAGR